VWHASRPSQAILPIAASLNSSINDHAGNWSGKHTMGNFSCSWYANIVLAEASISPMGSDCILYHIIFLLAESSLFIPVNTVSADQVAWVPSRPKVITRSMDAIPISTSHSSSTSRLITETPCFPSGGGNSMDGRYDSADVLEVAGCDADHRVGREWL
jgi:hypothetical protein